MIEEQLFELSLPYSGKRNKTVRVYIPEHGEGECFPAVYMTDGQNLFEDNRPYQFGCWYTREAVKYERQSSGKAAIIVGIHNDEGPVQRAVELTPKSIGAIRYPDDMPEQVRKMMVPDGEFFDDFIIGTVMPEIEKRFPVCKGRNNTAVCGSSSGGLQAFFTALSHPDKFCAAGVFSPAFPIYDTKDIINWTKNTVTDNSPYLYFYSGSGDKIEQEIRSSTEAVSNAISQFYPRKKLCLTVRPEQPHHERAWAEAFKELLAIFLSQNENF